MNPYLQEILHDITTRLAKLKDIHPTVDRLPRWSGFPQAKKEWIGLTDEEIRKIDCIPDDPVWQDIKDFTRAIEAKLKDKNT
jgi:hypothetical protein